MWKKNQSSRSIIPKARASPFSSYISYPVSASFTSVISFCTSFYYVVCSQSMKSRLIPIIMLGRNKKHTSRHSMGIYVHNCHFIVLQFHAGPSFSWSLSCENLCDIIDFLMNKTFLSAFRFLLLLPFFLFFD